MDRAGSALKELVKSCEMKRASEMALYLSFPVTMFWISNQAEYFEEYVVKRKRQIFPPEREDVRREIEEHREKLKKKKGEMLDSME